MKKVLALGVIILLFVTACSKKEVRKETVDSKTTVEAFAVAEKLRVAYLKTDRDTQRQNSTQYGYKSLLTASKPFDSAELTFTPALVEIYGETVHLYISWNGIWKRGGQTFENRGLGVFIFKERPLKLDQILRNDPFAEPE